MSRPYDNIDGTSMIKSMDRSIRQLRRGGGSRVPALDFDPEVFVRSGAMLYVRDGALFARLGYDDYLITGSPEPNPVPVPGYGWGDYYPELHATTTNPSGAGLSSTGKFRVEGSVCHFSLHFSLSSGWDRGSGNYQMSLPVPPVEYGLAHRLLVTGEVSYGGDGYTAVAPIETTDGLLNRLRYTESPNFNLSTYGSTSPAEITRITLAGAYEVAPAPAEALYVVPHQDDEMLTMGASIREELARGTKVYVMITSRGDGSGVRTSPGLTGPLGYTPTKEEFSAQRDKEFTESVRRLGAIPVVPTWDERYEDGTGTSALIQPLVQQYGHSDMALRATSPNDYHQDHRACGDAVVDLDAVGFGDGNPRLMLSAARRAQYQPAGKIMFAAGGRDAITAWHAWPYTYQNISEGWWGIGYLSTPANIDLAVGGDGTSYWHLP